MLNLWDVSSLSNLPESSYNYNKELSHDFLFSCKWVENYQESNAFFLFSSLVLITDCKYTFALSISDIDLRSNKIIQTAIS